MRSSSQALLFGWAALLLATSACATGSHEVPRPTTTVSPAFDARVYRRVAVYAKSNVRGISEGGLRQVEDQFMQALLSRGYIIAARSDLDEVLREQGLQRSEITEQVLARAGRALNATAVLLVTVNQVSAERYRPAIRLEGQSYYLATAAISARLVSAELAEVLWVGSYTGSVRVGSRREDEVALAPVAAVLASGFPRRQ